jgi:transposase
MDENKLPTEVEELKRILLHTCRELATSRQQVLELSSTVSQQEKKLEQKEQQILELLRALRGKQRERINPDQLLLFEIGELEQLIEEQQEEAAARPARRKKKHGRRLIPDGLPEEVIEYTVPEEERLCPVDGMPMPQIRWEESKQLDYVPPKMKVIVHRRAVYACPQKHDEATLVTAPKPAQPIEKGLAAPGLLAQVVVSKFGDHLPGYRQEDIFSRHGVEIRRSTIYDWLSEVANLCQPLYELIKTRVLDSRIIHTDDTQVKLIDTSLRSTRSARFWAYLGDRRNPYAVYDFTEDRTRDGPARFLKGFAGYLQADAYSAYDGIYLESSAQVIEVACWAHCRRYWHKARESEPAAAHHALAYITRLYEIESATAEADPAARQAARQEHAVPLLAELGSWLQEQTFLPKSLIGQAATYTRNQWQALNRYVEDGELSIDNNAAERAMRPVAIGRKNWLFVGSPDAGKRAATLMSLIASCKLNSVEPWAYLKDIFTRLPAVATPSDFESLLPDRWLQANPTHRWAIAQRRRDERKTKSE